MSELIERGGTKETFETLAKPRIVQADYAALRRDYPWLPTLSDGSPNRGAIDDWLLKNFAVVSQSQLQENEVNTDIATLTASPKRGVRFENHGRAAFIAYRQPDEAAECEAILSVKGVGVRAGRAPTNTPQSNGLLPAHCALYEYLMHKLVESVFCFVNAPHRVLSAYAVIDCGYDEILADGKGRYPAGLLVRQGHFRPMAGDLPATGSFAQRQSAHVEFILRQFGITSGFTSPWLCIDDEDHVIRADRDTGVVHPDLAAKIRATLREAGSDALDTVNVQFTDHIDWAGSGLELVDLHYGVRSRFENAVASTVSDRAYGLGSVLSKPNVDKVQPRPDLARWTDEWFSAHVEQAELNAWNIAEDDAPTDGFALCFMHVVRTRKGETDPEFVSRFVSRCESGWSR